MKQGDNLQPAYPLNTHKQDWAIYTFQFGMGASTQYYAAPNYRYTFWLDYDPFDVKNNKLLAQNANFQIFNNSSGSQRLTPYLVLSQYNDMTDELISSNLPTGFGQATTIPYATVIKAPFEFVDPGNVAGFGNNQPPTSSSNPNIPSGVSASVTNGGTLTDGQTYYYCVTSVDSVSFVESLPSSVVTAVPFGENQSIAITCNPIGTDTFNVYRNTVNDFSPTSTSIQVGTFSAGAPGYYINTVFTSQPASNFFQNDQGFYTLQYGYQGNSYSFGNGTMLAQGFVPSQSHLTAIYIGYLQHTNVTNPSTFYDINIELWNSSNQFVQHLGTIHPSVNPAQGANGLSSDVQIVCNNYSYNTCTDGVNRWVTLTQPTLKFNSVINVTPGQVYYLVFRQNPTSGSAYYSLGMNTDSNGNRSTYYYYPFASAYTATDGATSGWGQLVDANSKPISFPFLTQGNIGRFATTFWWGTYGTTYWTYQSGVPDPGTYKYLHLDFNQRI